MFVLIKDPNCHEDSGLPEPIGHVRYSKEKWLTFIEATWDGWKYKVAEGHTLDELSKIVSFHDDVLSECAEDD